MNDQVLPRRGDMIITHGSDGEMRSFLFLNDNDILVCFSYADGESCISVEKSILVRLIKYITEPITSRHDGWNKVEFLALGR